MFFNYFTSCGNINIHHIHIHNDCLCLSNRLNLYYCHRFPMKQFLHFNKLRTIYHFMSIQTTYVTCIWRCLLCFLTWLCCFYGCHHDFFNLFFACFHIVICHPTMFVSLPYITLCFCWCYLFGTLWYSQCTPCFCNSHTFFTQHCHLLWQAPKLLDRLKCESKVKTMEKTWLGARSLAHSTRKNDKYLFIHKDLYKTHQQVG
jgi:hypothetical protein